MDEQSNIQRYHEIGKLLANFIGTNAASPRSLAEIQAAAADYAADDEEIIMPLKALIAFPPFRNGPAKPSEQERILKRSQLITYIKNTFSKEISKNLCGIVDGYLYPDVTGARPRSRATIGNKVAFARGSVLSRCLRGIGLFNEKQKALFIFCKKPKFAYCVAGFLFASLSFVLVVRKSSDQNKRSEPAASVPKSNYGTEKAITAVPIYEYCHMGACESYSFEKLESDDEFRWFTLKTVTTSCMQDDGTWQRRDNKGCRIGSSSVNTSTIQANCNDSSVNGRVIPARGEVAYDVVWLAVLNRLCP